jgi:rhamnogalacturonyl hydrolase YesR
MKRLILAGLAMALCVGASAQRPDPAAQAREVAERVTGFIESRTSVAPADRTPQGNFFILSYEWGVTYSALLKLYATTGDERYLKYVEDRFKATGKVYGSSDAVRSQHSPRFLDDCGAMVAALEKATLRNPAGAKTWRAQLDRWFDFVYKEEYRLSDGILARMRPAPNSVWLDDMYMGIPPIAYRGAVAAQEGYNALAKELYAAAVEQILLFKKYLWLPEKEIFRHGWIEGMSVHPSYHWARANGWAVLTLCDVLDIVPEDTPGRAEALETLRQLLGTIASFQAPDGRWHQLLDHTETYLETSASAMFTYGFAHAVNQGWIDRTAYRDVALSGWQGIVPQVNEEGGVENTCVGTGLGWTNTFYANRPVSVFAAHGYGPVLLAASEIMQLVKP